jgi:hypothetical protein
MVNKFKIIWVFLFVLIILFSNSFVYAEESKSDYVPILSSCASVCYKDKCICPKSCLNVIDTKLPPNRTITKGKNCLGLSDRMDVACNNEKYDGYCPVHCRPFNDLDCQGGNYNIIDSIWANVSRSKWMEKQKENDTNLYKILTIWGVSKYASVLNPSQWAQSLCNPRNSILVKKIKNEDKFNKDNLILSDSTVGWINVLKDNYNKTHFVYVVSYYLSGLENENKYRFEISNNGDSNNDDLIIYPFEGMDNVIILDNKYWLEIGEFETFYNSSINYITNINYSEICMYFENNISIDIFTKDINKICRKIN